MFKIIESKFLSTDVKLFRIHAPRIAKKQLPGQFVILRINDRGERIPITIAGSDPVTGSVTIIVQGIGKTTKMLNSLESGDFILDVVGPLGKPSDIKYYGRVVVVGGGVGAAIAFPIAEALHRAGNQVISIVGARNKELIILQNEMTAISDSYWITTDDGSAGQKGYVTDKLTNIITSGEKIDYVLAVGPIPMMRAVAETTRPHGIETVVSLNAIMVDGTGMCGGCRVTIDGKSQFACIDGPEFDAHLVDFHSLQQRTAMYKEMEHISLDLYNSETISHKCRLTGDERKFDTVLTAQ